MSQGNWDPVCASRARETRKIFKEGRALEVDGPARIVFESVGRGRHRRVVVRVIPGAEGGRLGGMLTKEQVESLIFARALECADSCNSSHITACLGQIRGLLAVLTGQTPPPLVRTLTEVLDAAGIPYVSEARNGEPWILFDDSWLAAHGFDQPDDGMSPRHPTLSARW